ncbi:PhnA-like protein [Pseudaminobacter sp. 19-2017]|uniref:PhnA-like protein n=1 Tax=Pseudaminobacter soli (ex Zhang et al. 2022) TaxID=2831468 RepID=A0A942I4M6_9HYPH|nr:PhnA-like protein [Pseudaminobacter soli]MBS3652143.1 PhnA-like protein [Pseudaminobacter soli]
MSETFRTPSSAASDLDTVAATVMLHKVSWGAVFAGVIIALVVQVLLTLLGLGIGVGTLSPRAGSNTDVSTFSIVAAIWYIVSGIIAAYLGGYIAARLSGKSDPATGAFHGLTTWALTTLVIIYLVTTAVGGLVGGVFSGISYAVGGLGQTVARTAAPLVATSNPLEALEAQIRATGADPQALNNAAANAIRALVTGDQANADAARQQAAEALARARNIPVDQAKQQVAQIEQQYRQTVDRTKQQAEQAADAASSVLSKGALAAFVALVLGAIAGWYGGRSGVVHPEFANRISTRRRAAG